jgi:hypothetical protein
MSLLDDRSIYFYELHEGEDEVFSDLLLAHHSEYDEREFLEMVLEARERVIERYGTDTLIEAVARDLAAHHGFLVIDDSRLTVSVHVSAEEGGTVVTDIVAGPARGDEEPDYRSLLVDLDKEERRWGDA